MPDSPALSIAPAAAALEAPDQPKPKNAAEAAQQFEALLISQMLRMARESGGDAALGDGDDSTGDTMLDVAGQQFAQLLAQNGGFGLAKLIAKGLDQGAEAQHAPAD
jgi:Rod binding domain-containing protein